MILWQNNYIKFTWVDSVLIKDTLPDRAMMLEIYSVFNFFKNNLLAHHSNQFKLYFIYTFKIIIP